MNEHIIRTLCTNLTAIVDVLIKTGLITEDEFLHSLKLAEREYDKVKVETVSKIKEKYGPFSSVVLKMMEIEDDNP